MATVHPSFRCKKRKRRSPPPALLPDHDERLPPARKTRKCPPHGPSFLYTQCLRCGRDVEPDEGIAGSSVVKLEYMEEGLSVTAEFLDQMRDTALRLVQKTRKLLLVLDLDHTLLHSVGLPQAEAAGVPLEDGDYPGKGLFVRESLGYATKLRPYARRFLAEASKMYELYIYTMGSRAYALEMAGLLDPNGAYFGRKVICRSDCVDEGKKGLDVMVGHPSTIVVLDDTPAVWKKNIDNLVHMDPYHYSGFKARSDEDEDEERDGDEDDDDNLLVVIYDLLKRVHLASFGRNNDGGGGKGSSFRDVRGVLQSIKQGTLRGCRLVFSGLDSEIERFWNMAEIMGATCSSEVDPEATHVVCDEPEADEAKMAVEKGKFVVDATWVLTAYHSWRRPSEDDLSFDMYCMEGDDLY